MTAPTDVLVLGAGPAGLGAAYRLAERGHAVTVLERNDGPGGLAASFDVAGVRVDHGSHRLHPTCPPGILALLRRLLGDDLQLRRRHGRLRLADRWVAYPPRVGDLVRQLPPRFAFGLAFDACAAPWRRARRDTFAEVVRAGLGPTMANEFYDPYMRKIWAVAPDELSGELARRRVGARAPRDLIRKLARRNAGDGRGTFFYPRRGYGQISECLADAAATAGADIRYASEVVALDLTGGEPAVHLADGTQMQARHLWSTLPLPLLARLAGAHATEVVRAAAERLEFRGLTLAYLVLDRPRYTEYDAHYFPGLDVPFSRVSEPKNYRDGTRSDPPDRTVLCAELPCSVGDGIWSATAEDLGALVAQSLEREGLPAVRPADVVVRRVSHAYPVYKVGYEVDFATLDAWAAALAGVVTFGRQGLFAHDNTHHALAMGWAAADALRDDRSFDGERWGVAREQFRSHVVED
jgi:protoporphyrinogen oxidase